MVLCSCVHGMGVWFRLFNESACVLMYCLSLSAVVYGHEFDLQIPLETMWTDIDYADGVRVRVRVRVRVKVRVKVGMRVGVGVGGEGGGVGEGEGGG